MSAVPVPFRAFLDVLEERNATARITDEVSWDLEASAVTMLANETDDRIPIFEAVQSRNGDVDARLVGDPYRGPQRRPWEFLGRAFDLPVDAGPAYYEGVIDRLREPVDPTVGDPADAPCKEVVRTGADASLLEFPWPYIHHGDGGRYATLATLVAPAPDSEWGSWSRHRAMIHDASQASLLLLAGEQVPNLYYFEYEREDEPMPVALTIGAGPAVECTAEMWIPVGRSEVAYAGALQERPVELVPCETNDLRVPASAEVVIEGRVMPNERLDEGPFGDYFGYMNGPRRSMPVLEVDAITHREEPYLPFCVEGTGVGYGQNSSSTFQAAAGGPDATLGLRAAGFDVELAVPWPFTSRTAWVIATDRSYPGSLHELANFIFTTWGMLHIDFFVFVDGDVNPLNPRAVLEAIALHADPAEDFHQFGVERMPKVPLNIYQTPDEKGSATVGTSKTKTAKAYIDALSDGNRPKQAIGDEGERDRARELLAEAGVSESAFEPAHTMELNR
ncbi:UbiD family decarboxylase [Natronorubrum sp. JWXQ-INN-674]|uniref:UbiD family decarboxylase n=1 Tax=Natronorubrum halalkaliphilum TaxID=2691917 RepID=A0A6B0VP99_9EURY|nr:UbiD family decarboxylase [Natronorubrum halalkaliphilum]MXV62983.1 UbiD family decarboxylase [Natronorubrum halalkaliphilum]